MPKKKKAVENKDQNSAVPNGQSLGDFDISSNGGVVKEPLDTNALSYEPGVPEPLTSQEQPRRQTNPFLRFVRRADVLLVVLLFTGIAVGIFFTTTHNKQRNSNASTATVADRFGTVKIPLSEIVSGKDLTLAGAPNVTINGPIQLNDGLLLSPSLQPTGAKPGQIYYDQSTDQLAYYNGSNFVFLTGAPAGGVQSLGGGTGQLSLGGGLSLTGTQVSNSGVLSVQGQNGAVTLTAGAGIVINGTNFSNSGVLSVSAGNPNVSVTSDGQGNVKISVTGAGTGTVTSGGGVVGSLPLFTASQNIENSIVTQSGLTVTISGDLSVVTGGLTLSNALTVSNGGTGTTSLAANGVLVGHGTAAVSSVTSGVAGLCLLSTAGVPVWGACPSGSGVSSLNGLTGGLNIANASGVGTTVTIDDASTVNKGIASFNGTNFSVTGGAVNTAQNINTGATPTFAGVNTNNITPSAALTVGVSAQTALLQGSTTTITSNGAGNNIVLNSAASIELQDNTNVTGSITTTGDVAVNGGNLTSSGALNITPGGALTVGATSQTLTLQGGATSSFTATSGASTTVVAFTSPIANTTLNFPALSAGTYTICTTSGNCAGAGVTLQAAYSNSSSPEITLDATRGALTIRDNSTPLGANLFEVQNNAGSATYLAVTSGGIAVSGTATVTGTVNASTGTLQTNGTTRIDNSGNAVNIGSLTLSGAVSGGTSYSGSGNINTTAGALQTNSTTRIDNSGNLVNIVALTASGSGTFQGGNVTLGAAAQAGTITLSDGSSNNGILQVAALGQDTAYILPDPGASTATICLTTGNCAGTGGGVTTGGGTTNKLAKFTGAQAIGDSSISDDGTNVTVSVDVIVQGGDLTLGSTSQPASVILHDGNGQTTTLQAGDSAANLSFILPTNTGTANQCLKQSGTGNQLVWQDCDGGAGGSSATLQTAYNNSVNPEIVLNSSVGGLTIRDNSTPLGTNLFEIQNNAGSSTYLAVTVSGLSVTGTTTASGNLNTTAGALQTNSTTRIDNSGNLANIGNITGSGAITIASIGVGNNITVDGANQFVVQDASVFNALSTFNGNVDVGANDILGTTGNINLTNFDVAGATGAVTAGTYNGQTISSSANFTGTVTAAGNLTLTAGDIAVNGGDITSTGALNITPGGTLTVGATGQQLILQGSANTQLTATGSGFTTTVGFSGTPTAAVTYNFDRSVATGTYTICTTIGNCAGTGGGVTTSGGTTGTIAVFTGSQTLGDSLLSQSGSVVTVNGNLNLTSGNQFTVNGTQISSASLSNDANLAKLGSSQTFTGNSVAFQNGANSANAFNVQNAAGDRVITVDTAAAQVVLGVGGSLDGKLAFANMSNANTVTILPGTPTANRTLTLPDASGIICTNSGNCAGAGATLQTGYNFSTGGTTPKIKVNSTLLGVDIQDADTTIGADLFDVRASNAIGLGSVMFGVGSTGQVILQNASNSATAFRLLTAGGTAVLTGDTTNGQVILGQSGTLNGALVFNNSSNANTTSIALTTPTANRTITLPNDSGTVCLSSGNCSGSGSSNTLQAAYDAGNTVTTSNARDISFTLADTATDSNFLINLQCSVSCGSNGKFSIQNAGTDVFDVSPAGGAIGIQPTTDTATAFNMKTSIGNNIFTVDTLNGRVGIGLGGNNTPGLTHEGLEVKGALRLSGAFNTYADNYISPLGNSVATMINVLNYDPGAYNQIIALGLPSTANTNSRVITVLDARAGAHQPSLAVISPNENEVGGFSWDGSSSDFKVKNSNTTGSIMLNVGGTDTAIIKSTGLGVGMTPNASYKIDAAGDINISSGSSYRINGTAICTSSGCTPVPGSASYIQNQNASVQTAANFWVSGTGRADTSILTPTIDAVGAASLNVGSTNATVINLGQSTVNTVNFGKLFSGDSVYVGTTSVPGVGVNGRLTSISGNATTITGVFRAAASQSVDVLQAQDSTGACLWRVSQSGTTGSCDSSSIASGTSNFRSGDVSGAGLNSGSVTLRTGNSTSSGNTGNITIKSGDATSGTAGSISIDNGSGSSAGVISIGTGASAHSIGIGTGAANQSVTIGSTSGTSTLTLDAGTGAINIGTSAGARTVAIATGAAYQGVTIGSTSGASSLLLQGGTGNVTIKTAGTTSAFLVQDTSGQALFNIDSANGWNINNGNTHPNNLLENPSFEANATYTASGWNFSSQGAISSAGSPHHGKNEFVYTPNGTLLILSSYKYLEAQPGDQFYAEVWYKVASGTNGTSSFSFSYYDKNKSNIGTSSVTNFSTANTSYTLATVTGTAPANTAYVRLTTGVNATSTTGAWYFDDYTMVRTNQQAPFTFKNNVNSQNALQVLDSSSNSVLNVDTTNRRVGIGTNSATPSRTLDVSSNDSVTATPAVRILQAGSGDASAEFANSGASFYMGLDASSGAFAVGSSTSAVSTTTSGNVANDNYDSGNNNMISSTKVTAGATGTVSTISVYIGNVDATNKHMQVALYSDVGGTNALGTVLTSSATQTLTPNAWNSFSVSAASVTSGATYWLAFNVDGSGTQYGYANTGTSKWTNNTVSFGTWSNNPTITFTGSQAYQITMTIAPAGVTDTFNNSLFSLGQSGNATFKVNLDSANAFRVLDSSGNTQFAVDTSTQKVYVGDPGGSNSTGLQVQGAATVNGLLTAGTFTGAGLTDCSSSNSKLLWNSSTKQFSCGTDRASFTIRKAADETVNNSSVMQNDDDFTFSIGANETWAFQIYADVVSSTAADFKATVTAPASSTCRIDFNNIYNVQNNYITSCGVTSGVIPHSDSADEEYIMYGTVVSGATSGSVTLQWAQQTATAVNTTMRAGGYMVAYKISGADLAEAYYTKDTSMTPGDIVAVDGSLKAGVKKSEGAYDSHALGIVSTQPGFILGDNTAIASDGQPVLLALSGRVPVKVSMENGPIEPGDYLTTSSTPGVAMKATKPGQMIGKALEGFSSDNSAAMGTVMTFANLTWADPSSGVTSNNTVQGSTSASDLNVSGSISTSDLTVTNKATIAVLQVGTMTANNVTIQGNANIAGDLNLQGTGLSRNAITKRFKATKAIAIGAVVIADSDNDGQVTTTMLAADTRVLGVALTAANPGDDVTVAIGGTVQTQAADGSAINAGDLLVSAAQEGTAEKATNPGVGSLIGKALSRPADGKVWTLISLQ